MYYELLNIDFKDVVLRTNRMVIIEQQASLNLKKSNYEKNLCGLNPFKKKILFAHKH